MRRIPSLIVLFLVMFLTFPAFGQDEEAVTPDTPEIAAELPVEDIDAPVVAPPEPEDEPVAEEVVEPVPETVPETLDEAIEDVSLLIQALDSKSWPVVVGFALMVVVFILNKLGLKDKVGSKAVPWVTMGIAIAATVGVALASGSEVLDAVIQGVTAGLAAIGSWEVIFKKLLGSKKEAASST
jgi:hypothetical protein